MEERERGHRLFVRVAHDDIRSFVNEIYHMVLELVSGAQNLSISSVCACNTGFEWASVCSTFSHIIYKLILWFAEGAMFACMSWWLITAAIR